MKKTLSMLLLGGVLAAGCATTQQHGVSNKVESSLEKVKPEDIKAHIAYLAEINSKAVSLARRGIRWL